MTLPADPVARLRLLMVVPALAGCAISFAAIAFASHDHAPLRVAAALAVLALAALWYRGYTRRSFSVVSEVVEALVLALVLLGSPGQLPLPLFGTTYRALYGGTAVAALRVTAWMAGVVLTEVVHGSFELDDVSGKAAGLLLGAMLMRTLLQAVQRMRRSESHLRAVLERSTDVVTIVGADLRILWQAASIRRVLGHAPERLEGTPFTALLHPDDAPAIERLLGAGTLAPGDACTIVVRMRDAEGGYRDVEAVVGNRTLDEHVAGFLLSLRDVTERRRLERERESLARQRVSHESARASLEHLRERVEAQRQRQELEGRLQRSQRLQSVGQLAGGVAHDFNNLLAAILNYAAIVREDVPAEAAVQADLAEIEDAARRGARLVHQLLLFSQGKLTEPETLDLNGVVQRLDRLLGRTLGEQVRLRYELEPELWPIEADVTNVEQVLVNLVVNARDALGLSGGTVTVMTANAELAADDATDLDAAPGRYVRLSVSDDGCGMDADVAARAIEPFFTTKPVGKGTGLGLATVLGIVTHAGGCLTLDSRPGEGTTVNVHLPRLVA
jgi:PAS domain S-box-containing protein